MQNKTIEERNYSFHMIYKELSPSQIQNTHEQQISQEPHKIAQ